VNPTAPGAPVDFYALQTGFIDFVAAVGVLCVVGIVAVVVIVEIFKD
jgi:hypothetical protein